MDCNSAEYRKRIADICREHEGAYKGTGLEDDVMLVLGLAGIGDSIGRRVAYVNANLIHAEDEDELVRCIRDLRIYGYIMERGTQALASAIETMLAVAKVIGSTPQAEAPHSDEGWAEFLRCYGGWYYFTAEDLEMAIRGYLL